MNNNTVVLTLSESCNDKELDEALSPAAEVIRSGGLVAFPTETVYGLGADATNSTAAQRIYEAKGRPSDNPLIIHIASACDAEKYAYTNETYFRLADRFMPGPLTVVLKARDTVPHKTRGGLDTVAVRCPSNRIANRLISLAGVAIAAPSANLSGSPSPTKAKHVIDDMTGRVDVIIDGGDCDFGLESTIVKICDDGRVVLLRPGKVTVEDISSLGLKVEIASAVTSELKSDEIAESPGMKYRHYAPEAEVLLLDGDRESAAEYIKSSDACRIGIICYTEDMNFYREALPGATLYDFGRKDDSEKHARLLFDILRVADKESFEKIYAPLPETCGIGLALYNRMIRAAAHKIIRL